MAEAHDSGALAVADILAGFVVGTTFQDLPRPVVEAARWRLLDVIGSALWGIHAGTASAMRRVVERAGGVAEASVLGRPLKLPGLSAAYLNSSASPALLDTCRFSVTHPGIVTVPAALAATEMRGASGRELLRSIVLGYEVMIRLGRHARPSDQGFVPSGVFGPFGAATAAALALDLNAEQVADALGLAGTMGAGILDGYGTVDGGRNQFGRASQAGLLAALLAEEGAKGNRRILEGGALDGTRGFMACHAPASDLAAVVTNLGTDYSIMRVASKVHDGCRYTNPAADAALQLVREHGLRADQVESVEIGTFSLALEVSVRQPTTVSGALFCMEFVVATALLEGNVSTPRFSLERLEDASVQALMKKISVALDEDAERAYPGELGLRMSVRTVDGRQMAVRLAFPRGEPENPVSEADTVARFEGLAGPLVGAGGVRRILDELARVDTAPSIEGLLAACRVGNEAVR